MSDGINAVNDGAILEITIDRPKANAIDLPASRRLNQVITEFHDDPTLRIAIIASAGERLFSPGWDLKAAATGEESDSDWVVGTELSSWKSMRNLHCQKSTWASW